MPLKAAIWSNSCYKFLVRWYLHVDKCLQFIDPTFFLFGHCHSHEWLAETYTVCSVASRKFQALKGLHASSLVEKVVNKDSISMQILMEVCHFAACLTLSTVLLLVGEVVWFSTCAVALIFAHSALELFTCILHSSGVPFQLPYMVITWELVIHFWHLACELTGIDNNIQTREYIYIFIFKFPQWAFSMRQ